MWKIGFKGEGPTGSGVDHTGPKSTLGVLRSNPINTLFSKTYPEPVSPAEVSPPAEVSSVEFIIYFPVRIKVRKNFNLFVIIFQSGVHIEVLFRKFGWTRPQSLRKLFNIQNSLNSFRNMHSVVANIELKFVKKNCKSLNSQTRSWRALWAISDC